MGGTILDLTCYLLLNALIYLGPPEWVRQGRF